MVSQNADLPPDFDGEVRLFPLPNHVLFPGNLQPLHVFESRYCEMLESALESDQLITMATLEPDFEREYYGRPPIAPFVCVGKIIAHQRNADETHELLLAGLRRARIEEEFPPLHSFREANVEILEDSIPKDSVVVPRLHKFLRMQLQALTAHAKPAGQALPEDLPLGAITDILAFHLPLGLSLKLRLLGELNVLRRATLITEALNTHEDDGTGDGLPKFSEN